MMIIIKKCANQQNKWIHKKCQTCIQLTANMQSTSVQIFLLDPSFNWLTLINGKASNHQIIDYFVMNHDGG